MLEVSFGYWQTKFPQATDASNTAAQVLKEGEVQGSDVAAHSAGVLDIKTNILPNADALFLTAIDPYGHELWRWTFPVDKLNQQTEPISFLSIRPTYTETENDLTVKANKRTFIFSKKDGQLKGVSVDNRKISFANGPRFIGARRADRSLDQFYNHDDEKAKRKKTVHIANSPMLPYLRNWT